MLAEAPVSMMTSAEFYEEPSLVVFSRTLTANQELTNIQLYPETDSDFEVEAVWGSSDGAYEMNWRWPSSRNFGTARVKNANLVGTPALPMLLPVPVRIGRGNALVIEIKNLTGAANEVQVVFAGRRITPTRGA